ncbi:MAG: YIP1 family protein [Bacilli bacterium]|nr:YIP1 family protein [Bacilli bacterium]MBN2876320.1 YIP1 family protein [Bacilli bacterium]
MKKWMIAFLLLIALTLTSQFVTVFANNDFYENEYPYETYTVDYEGNLTFTQTAYIPVGVLNRDVALFNPEDLYIKDDLVYIADTGNKRVAVLDYSGTLIQEIGVGVLEKPTGVFVSEENFLYIADQTNQLVYKYDLDGNFIRTFGHPVEPLFGSDSPYTPIKVVVGSGENIYIIGDGSTSGVIQLNYDGSFLGYFGVNLSQKSLIEKIADIFVNPGEYASNTPPSPTNIAINSKSLVYTSTPNTVTALKKLDVNGNNILTTINYHQEQNVVDLSVDSLGYLYAIYDDGLIVEYDPNGNLLFAFDVMSSSSNVLGLIQNPSGIQIDSYHNIFVLDTGRSEVITYQPTSFTNLVHDAINLYNQGSYEESTLVFEAILKQNDNFALAHSALGKSYYQDKNYQQALEEYYKANDVEGYSTTFWKIRDIWLKENLNLVFYLILALILVSYVIKQLNRRTLVFQPITRRFEIFKKKTQVRKYSLVFSILKHPLDSYYEIKREKRANVFSASIILVILFIEYLFYLRYTGYIFNNSPEQLHLGMQMAVFFGIILLFIFSNYLISTLFDGEGWMRDVYVSVIYSLAPIVVFLPFYIILSNVLTLNELVILQIYGFTMISYTIVLIFLAIREIHNYEIGETFKNIALTIFTMLIIILIGFIIYVFGSQLFDFLTSWLKEVFFRVFG